MIQEFSVKGMTCQNCAMKVRNHLSTLDGAEEVRVSLNEENVRITANRSFTLGEIQSKLPQKYRVTDATLPSNLEQDEPAVTSKWKQLGPLFLIFGYLIGGTILMNAGAWNTKDAMLDFMGLFYMVFSFFKLLDVKGFAQSFQMYDPLAKLVPVYGWAYPFLELVLGLFFLLQFQIPIALWATLLVLGSTTVGVSKVLLDKKAIRCACLGTTLKLPMTEATFIENAIMLVMALYMLL